MIDPNWLIAGLALLTLLGSGVMVAISVGVFKQRQNESDKRHDNHDKRFEKIENDVRGVQVMMTDIAVMKTEMGHATHDIRGIKQILEGLRKFDLRPPKDAP